MGWTAAAWSSTPTGDSTGGTGGGTDYDASPVSITSGSNGWTLLGVTYQKDISGHVSLQGTIKPGTRTAGTLILSVPTNRAPAGSTSVTVATTGGSGSANVSMDSTGGLSVVSVPGTVTALQFVGAGWYVA